MQPLKDFADRILPDHPGQRELLFVAVLFISIAGAGFLGGYSGWLHNEVPSSTPSPLIEMPATPVATPDEPQ